MEAFPGKDIERGDFEISRIDGRKIKALDRRARAPIFVTAPAMRGSLKTGTSNY